MASTTYIALTDRRSRQRQKSPQRFAIVNARRPETFTSPNKMPTLEPRFSTGSLNGSPVLPRSFVGPRMLERPCLTASSTNPSDCDRLRSGTFPDREVLLDRAV